MILTELFIIFLCTIQERVKESYNNWLTIFGVVYQIGTKNRVCKNTYNSGFKAQVFFSISFEISTNLFNCLRITEMK